VTAPNAPPAPRWEERLEHAAELRRAALAAADPAAAVRRHLRRDGERLWVGQEQIALGPRSRVLVVGAGKAGVAMAEAARAVLGERLSGGCLAVPQLPRSGLEPIEFIRGGHPVPDEGTLAAGRRMAELLAGAGPDDLVLALISGGASALLELPVAGITLAELQATNQALLRSGATVVELNVVRKRLSQIKGGGLARLAAPARVAALILSDVVGDPLESIGSGPTVPDPAPPEAAREIIERYRLIDKLPPSVSKVIGNWELAAGSSQPSIPNPQLPIPNPQSPRFASNLLIASNALAAQAAVERAEALGFRALLLTTFVEGEAREVGRVIAGLAKGLRRHGHPLPPPACLVLGGETTVTVTGAGAGGRNQELALAAAIALDGWPRAQVMTLATDGVDGASPAAGALATGETAGRARERGLSPQAALAANDSHAFFEALGDAIHLGPTGTNVNDLIFVFVY
jgi:hydroxypyruvate reductase